MKRIQSEDMCFLIAATLIIASVFVFYKRLELLGLLTFVTTLFMGKHYFQKKLPLAVLMGGGFLLVCYIIYKYQDVFTQSWFVRLSLWQNAWQLGIKNFPSGVGLGQYQAQGFMPEAHLMQGARCTEFQYPHNQFLYWFVELGIIGVALSIAFIKLILEYLKHLTPLWKYSIFAILMIISCTHDIISLRSFPILLALMWIIGSRTSERLKD
jgi:O-antigen ligase